VGVFACTLHGCRDNPPAGAGDASAREGGADAQKEQASVEPFRGPDAPPKDDAKFPVVVTIVIDQLAAWIVDSRMSALRPNGGFARLAHDGTYVREMRYAHAVTDTAPGHAALYTGLTPHQNGIVSNERIDDAFNRVSVLLDPKAFVVDVDGPHEGDVSSSISVLQAPTLADELRKQKPDAVIISLSLKDRGAIFGGGRNPTDSIWYDATKGHFITSTAFTRTAPPWLANAWKDDHAPYARKSWDAPLRPEWVKAHTASPDAQEGEGDYAGLKATYPHDLAAASSPEKAFRATPFGDRVLLQMALRAMDERGAGFHPTLVALSLSSNDYIGHIFGPDSWEAWDELDRLDQQLGAFFRALDNRFGASGWGAVLAADHGTPAMPETAGNKAIRTYCAPGYVDRWKRPCEAGERIVLDRLRDELDAVAVKTIGAAPAKSRWVSGVADPYVWLSADAKKLPAPKKKQMLDAVKAALLAHPGVAKVLSPEDFPDACPPEEIETQDALLCRAHKKDVGGEYYLLLKPGSFFDPNYAIDHGTSHGSELLYDRAVPLFVRPGRASAHGRISDTPVSFRAFERNAAALLQIVPPKAVETAPVF